MFELDQKLFYFFNTTLSNSFFDQIMPTLTDLHKEPLVQYLLLPLLLFFWIYKKRKQMRLPLLGLILAISASDLICYRILKPTFKRDRPPAIETVITIRAKTYAGYSFPSNHAANNFAAATFLSLCYPALTPLLILIASIGAFSRIYVGVHYPLDILGGAFLGILLGFFFFKLFSFLFKEKFIKSK